MGEFDAIVVPGGGVRDGGLLPSWVRCRLDRAAELYRGEYIIALSAGTPHRPPPIDEGGFPIFESAAAARYLIDAGVRPERILIETCSYDTIGNAYFSRVIHVEPRSLRRLLVITSDFHLPRTQAVFQWVYGLAPGPADYELRFEPVTDPGMAANLYAQRCRKERESLDEFARIASPISTMQDCHRWLFTAHGAYKAERPGFRQRAVTPEMAESY